MDNSEITVNWWHSGKESSYQCRTHRRQAVSSPLAPLGSQQTSFKQSSLVTGPGLDSSPSEARNPGIFCGSQATFHLESSSFQGPGTLILPPVHLQDKDICP
ncbi:uncharacterized protein ACBT57_005708 isoform 1-T1 [Dama dama]